MIQIGLEASPEVIVTQELELDWTRPARLLGTVSSPTLVVHGDSDKPVPVALARTIVEAMPDARLEPSRAEARPGSLSRARGSPLLAFLVASRSKVPGAAMEAMGSRGAKIRVTEPRVETPLRPRLSTEVVLEGFGSSAREHDGGTRAHNWCEHEGSRSRRGPDTAAVADDHRLVRNHRRGGRVCLGVSGCRWRSRIASPRPRWSRPFIAPSPSTTAKDASATA